MRPYHNLHKYCFGSDNKYGFPLLPANTVQVNTEKFIDFHTALSISDRSCGVHFFIDDFKFERLWTYPERYINFLKDFECVIMPDFSLYYNAPEAVGIYNKYRNHWLYCYYTMHGVNMIPLYRLGSPDFFEWSNLGFPPERSVFAVSDIGCRKVNNLKNDFKLSLDNLTRLQPLQVLYFTHSLPDFLSDFDFDCKFINLDYIRSN